MFSGTVEIDLHGKNAYQARVALDALLRRVDASVYRIRVIHGFNSGTRLKETVWEYASHPKVRRIAAGESPGCSYLILREY